MYKKLLFLSSFLFLSVVLKAQKTETAIDYSTPKEYEIGGIAMTGSEHMDVNVLKLLSGLNTGDKIQIPGDRIATAITNLWKQGLFEDIKITASKIDGNIIYLNIGVTERPKLNKYTITGVRKGEADDLREKIKLTKGKVLTDVTIAAATQQIKDFL